MSNPLIERLASKTRNGSGINYEVFVDSVADLVYNDVITVLNETGMVPQEYLEDAKDAIAYLATSLFPDKPPEQVYNEIMAKVAELWITGLSVQDPAEIILESIKIQLGLSEENHDFDSNLVLLINSAIFSLRQIGIGPLDKPYSLTLESAKTATYADYLGANLDRDVNDVKAYIYYKVLLSFDAPTNGGVLATIKEELKEAEWRLTANAELPILNGKEEIQNGDTIPT